MHIGFEDDHIAVAWKPHGLLTSGNDGNTFLRKVSKHVQAQNHTEIAACHRLDFPTSGWVVFGKNVAATRAMGQLFAERRVHKAYLALVHGVLPPSLRLEWPMEGKQAVTAAQCLAQGTIAGGGAVSLALLRPLTGRTHQLRRHLHGVGHGIVGDDTYTHAGGIYRGKGLFLCAYELDFEHPIVASKRVRVQAPPSKKFTKIPFVHRSEFVAQLRLSSHA